MATGYTAAGLDTGTASGTLEIGRIDLHFVAACHGTVPLGANLPSASSQRLASTDALLCRFFLLWLQACAVHSNVTILPSHDWCTFAAPPHASTWDLFTQTLAALRHAFSHAYPQLLKQTGEPAHHLERHSSREPAQQGVGEPGCGEGKEGERLVPIGTVPVGFISPGQRGQ